MAQELAELFVKITTDLKDLEKAMSQADKTVADAGKKLKATASEMTAATKQVGIAMVAIGAAIVGAFTLAIKSWADAGHELKIMSERTGMSADELSKLKYAAERTGSSLDEVGTAIRILGNQLQAAGDGSKTVISAFDRIGLSVSDLQGMKPDQLFETVASAIAKIPDPMVRSATAVDLFGRSGTNLLPMLQNLEALKQEAIDLGLVWTDNAMNSAAKFNDALEKLKASGEGLRNEIVGGLVPAITPLIDGLTDIVKKMGEFAQANPDVTEALGSMTLGFGGAALTAGTLLLAVPKLIGALNSLALMMNATKLMAGGMTAALTVGIGMMAYGISEAIRYHQMAVDWETDQKVRILLQEELVKYNKGEANSLEELANQYKDASPAAKAYFDAFEDYNRKVKEAAIVHEEFKKKVSDVVGQFQYATSQAGKYGLTLDDVILHAKALHISTDDIAYALEGVKDSGDPVNDLMVALGLSVEGVNKQALAAKGFFADWGATMDAFTEKVTASKEFEQWGLYAANAQIAFENLNGEIAEFIYNNGTAEAAIAKFGATAMANYTALNALSGEQNAALYEKLMAAMYSTGTYKTLTEAEYQGIMTGFWGYDSGGLAKTPQIATLAEHGPEYVLPADMVENMGGNVVINFNDLTILENEQSLQRLSDMVTKKQQRINRLNLGSA